MGIFATFEIESSSPVHREAVVSQLIPHIYPIKGQPCRVSDLTFIEEGGYLEPHRHEYSEIVWCLDDEGNQSIDFVEYKNKKGRFFTIAPGQIHHSESMGKNVRILTLTPGFIEVNHRSTQLMSTVFAIYGERLPYLDCREEGTQHLTDTFDMLQQECSREHCDWDLVEALVNCFLRYVLRYSMPMTINNEAKDMRISRLITLIEQNYTAEKQCQFYADELALTSKRLNEIVKAEKGKTVTQLIHDRLILEANRSLVFSTKTIKTIAIELGFEDPAYFSRFYKTHMKESPAEFRLRCADSAT